MKYETAAKMVGDELQRATRLFGDFPTQHHGYAVIREELDELWEAIRENPRDQLEVREEAIQVAAMALRFLVDTCPGPGEWEPVE